MPIQTPKRTRRTLFGWTAVLAGLLVVLSVGPCAYLFYRQNQQERWKLACDDVAGIAEHVATLNGEARLQKTREANQDYCQKFARSTMGIAFLAVEDSRGPKEETPSALVHYFAPRVTKPLDKLPDWLALKENERPDSVRIVYSPDAQENVITTASPIMRGSIRVGWAYVGFSARKYEQSVAAGLWNIGITAAGAIALGLTGAFLLARRVRRPLGEICDMVDGIAAGDLKQRAAVTSVGEVQHLADHMNWMAEKLEASTAELEQSNARLRERVENEQLLSRISADFLFAESSAPEALFMGSLERIARRLKVDGASIFLHDTADHATLSRAWEWHADEAPECTIGRAPTAGFPWATAIATGHNVVTITDTRELPAEASAERANLERLHIRSAAAALLGAGDKATGYFFLRNAEPRQWTPEEEQFIHLAAGIFSNAIARREAAAERERLHSQLLQAQKMEAVGKLSGGIAHDFNNMLVPIVGYSDTILAKAPADAPWVEEIREIKRSAESAASLTRQLLTFSRRQIISRREMDMNALVQKLQNMMRRLIGENINLQTELAPDLWTVSADASQLEQCLMNLVVNAKAAMPRGGTIRLSTCVVDSEDKAFKAPPLAKPQGLFIRISVRDTGCGMDAQTLSRIFEPFFSTKGEEGTGLGLSVVYGIMQEHGGWITVDSEVGTGTAFHLWIPALNEPLPQPMDTGLTVARPLPRGKGERILLVEDEPGVLAFVSAALRQHGYHVLTADCGASAREVFGKEGTTLDLVMSDVVLPDTTGVELLEEFFTTQPGLRALLSSGYSEKQALLDLVEKRGLHFLHKPYTLIQLLEAVHKALSGVKPETVVA